MLTITDIEAARERIKGAARRTPMMRAEAVTRQPFAAERLSLKLECLQVTGSFKARGAMNKLLSLPNEMVQRGIVTASGGNHGMAVAYAGWRAQVPTTVFLPFSTPFVKAAGIERWGANVVFKGAVWDEANAAALSLAERDGLAYFHPFADPHVIAGQGTIALELLEDAPDVDTLLVAIGGGGLISGICVAAKALKPSLKIIGVEPVGAPTLQQSVAAGRLVELPEIRTQAGTLAPRLSAAINLEIIRKHVDQIVLVSDEEMAEAARWLWSEMQIAAELSGSAALAALLTGKIQTRPDEHVCALVCGAGTDGQV